MYELLTTPSLDRAQWKSRLHNPNTLKYLYFTPAWPDAQSWLAGKYFQITQTVVVSYPIDRIIPGNDQIDLDLSNNSGGLGLYPAGKNIVYEILVGLKQGNYQVGVYIPTSADFLLALGKSGIRPNLADPDLRNLGTITPEQSPFDNPLLKLWAIYQMDSWILTVDMLPGVDFGKLVLGFAVAKHRIVQIAKPEMFTTIQHFNELKGGW